ASHLGEVLTGGERASGAGDHHARDIGALSRVLQRGARRVIQLVVERVQCFGAVEREHAYARVVDDFQDCHVQIPSQTILVDPSPSRSCSGDALLMWPISML